jgi:alkylhydroperoxidase/carboxymuconolactone decarboxylase family protein YurZ
MRFGRGNVDDHETVLRKLALRDDALIDAVFERQEAAGPSGLHPKTWALVRLGALIAADATPPSYLRAVDAAREAGATDDEIVGTLIAVMPSLGAVRVVAAAPKLGLAMGYDVDAALEQLDA